MKVNKILMLGLALLSLNVNNLKAMEENNNNNITYNKLSINKQTDFEINNYNSNIIQTQQEKIQKLESKIDEIIERQKMFEKSIIGNNNVLHKEIRQLNHDLRLSSTIFGSVNNISDNITKNTEQMNDIKKNVYDSHKKILNNLGTVMNVSTHCITSSLGEIREQTEKLKNNNEMVSYLINLINTMFFGNLQSNNVMPFIYQNPNYINNTINNNAYKNNTENKKIEDKKIEDKKVEDKKIKYKKNK